MRGTGERGGAVAHARTCMQARVQSHTRPTRARARQRGERPKSTAPPSMAPTLASHHMPSRLHPVPPLGRGAARACPPPTAPAHDRVAWILSSSMTIDMRCVMSPMSLNMFIMASGGGGGGGLSALSLASRLAASPRVCARGRGAAGTPRGVWRTRPGGGRGRGGAHACAAHFVPSPGIRSFFPPPKRHQNTPRVAAPAPVNCPPKPKAKAPPRGTQRAAVLKMSPRPRPAERSNLIGRMAYPRP